MNPDIRLIAVDEDGTFVRPDYSFDRERFSRLWDRMAELGVRFVVATGNQHHQAREVFGERYCPHMGVVAENGAYVADGYDEVWYGRFDAQTVERIVDAMHDVGAPVLLDGLRAAYAGPDESVEFCADLSTYFTVMERVDNLKRVDDEIVMASTHVDPDVCDDVMARLTALLEAQAMPVASGDGYFDMLLPHTNKATGVARLAERWGIASEQCACFGNSYNDLEMVEWAGLGVFMGNAPDDLKPKANLVAPPCTEDGVLTVMEQLLF